MRVLCIEEAEFVSGGDSSWLQAIFEAISDFFRGNSLSGSVQFTSYNNVTNCTTTTTMAVSSAASAASAVQDAASAASTLSTTTTCTFQNGSQFRIDVNGNIQLPNGTVIPKK